MILGIPLRCDGAILRSALASDLRIAACCWLLGGAITLAAAWLGEARLPRGERAWRGRQTMLETLVGVDGAAYKQIAQHGYSYQPHQLSDVVFFPLYPLAALDLAMLTGLSLDAALVVLPNLCFAAALVLLSSYCRCRWPGAPSALRWLALLACALFPAGCFFRLAYSESCFLLLSLAAFYGMQRRWPLGVTAAAAGLASAARPVGVALLLPLALHVWQDRPSLRSRLVALALWLPVGCWGLLAFMAYQAAEFGNPLAFADAQQSYDIRPQVPAAAKALALATLEPIRAVYNSASPAHWRRYDRHWALSWQFANPLFFLAACGLVVLGWRRRWLSRGEAAYAALLLFIPYVTRGYEMGMGSMGRYVTVAFPMYLALGHLLLRMPRWAACVALAAMALYLAIFSARFGAGHFVF